MMECAAYGAVVASVWEMEGYAIMLRGRDRWWVQGDSSAGRWRTGYTEAGGLSESVQGECWGRKRGCEHVEGASSEERDGGFVGTESAGERRGWNNKGSEPWHCERWAYSRRVWLGPLWQRRGHLSASPIHHRDPGPSSKDAAPPNQRPAGLVVSASEAHLILDAGAPLNTCHALLHPVSYPSGRVSRHIYHAILSVDSCSTSSKVVYFDGSSQYMSLGTPLSFNIS